MKNLMRIILSALLLFATLCFTKTYAQISEGGIPPSFAYANSLKHAKAPVLIQLDADVDKLRDEDAQNEANGKPLRVAKIITANLTIENSGEWITLPNGQLIWQLTVQTPKALATLLYYNQFYIPFGAKLFIYNKDKTQILGAYNHLTNPINKEFATEFVAGDVFTLEYVAAGNEQAKPRISISGIAYGYNHITTYQDNTIKTFGESASCMVNINCDEGNAWKEQKQGVARTITPIGNYSYYCSGTIVNNTDQDFTPYYLSAHHCFYSSDGGTYAGESGLNQMVFYFNYELPGCQNLSVEPASNTMTGAQMLVDTDINGSSDGALLILNEDIPENYYVYYNGWDYTNVAATNGVTIHHPRGDVKKISTYTTPLVSATWRSDSETGAPDNHWMVRFARTTNGYGVTQGGSSGSPLFNQNGLVVGTLTGGTSLCSSPSDPDLYGKFWAHWDQDKNPAKHMKIYLDPLNKNQNTLEGAFAKKPVASPTNLTATLVGGALNQVQLAWKAPVDEDGLLPPLLSKYLLYRNDIKMGETSSTSYLDQEAGKIGNNLCYKVHALYTDNLESGPSNTACVFVNVPVTGIQLSPTNMDITQGNSYSLSVSVLPNNASNKVIKSWVSSNAQILSVDANGTITANNYGTAVITATTDDGNFTATCKVDVYTIEKGSIKPSEAFSPNGDGVNDYFIIERIKDYPDNELLVFDRSGTLHYTTKGYANDWSGTANTGPYKGKKLPAGTYYYQLIVNDKIDVKKFIVIRY